MPTLELLIDASGAQRGAQQAEAALRSVKTAADATATSTAKIGQNLSNAFQATGGTIQVAQGISQTAQALNSLNVASAAFGASRTLLEISKTADDFRQLSGSVVTTTRDIYGIETATRRSTGVWSAFGGILRAHPILSIASILGTVASAISLVGSNTRSTAQEWDRLADSMRKARSLSLTEGQLGIGNGESQSARSRAVRDALQLANENPNQTFSVGQVQELLDEQSIGRLLGRLSEMGNESATRFIGGQPVLSPTSDRSPIPPSAFQVTGEQFRRLAIGRYREISTPSVGGAPSNLGPLGTGFGPGLPGEYTDYGLTGGYGSGQYMMQSASDKAEIEYEYFKKIEERMAKAAEYAGQIGDSFGQAMADVLFKTSSLRQVLASLLQQGVRSGLGQIGSSIFSAAVSGLTPGQQKGNAGIAPTAGPTTSAPGG